MSDPAERSLATSAASRTAPVEVDLPNRVLDALRPIGRALGLVREFAPGLAVATATVMVLDAALTVVSLYVLKLVVDGIGQVASGAETAASLSGLLAVAAGGFIAAAIARSAAQLCADHLAQTVSDRLESHLNAHLAAIDLERLESPQHYDEVERALLSGSSRPAHVVTNGFTLAQNAVLLGGMLGLLTTIHWSLTVLLGAALVPGILVRFWQGRVLHDWQVRRLRSERRAAYQRWLLADRHSAKEVRIHGLAGFLGGLFDGIRDQLRAEKLSIGVRRTLIELTITLTVTVAFFAVIGWLVARAVSGDTAVGDLVLFVMVFLRGQSVVLALKQSLGALFDDQLYLRALFDFLSRPNAITDPADPAAVPMRASLDLRNVRFRYPGTSRAVLDDVSMSVRAGSIVAVVGANGSGKSTLIKMICRFYDPESGSVSWGGRDVRAYRVAEYRSRIGALFQDYVSFDATVRDNIRYGDIARSEDSTRIQAAARLALVDEFARELPQGYATHLGRMLEEGHEPSVGQWQRLALARALVSDSDLLILDEPTSAMDPDAEARLFGNFREMLGGRSALVISHRLSIVRGADYIYVMRDGRIVEEGTHDDLMARRGGYHDLFMAQAQAYRVEQSA